MNAEGSCRSLQPVQRHRGSATSRKRGLLIMEPGSSRTTFPCSCCSYSHLTISAHAHARALLTQRR